MSRLTHALSSGRKPVFFWFDLGLARSISSWAVLEHRLGKLQLVGYAGEIVTAVWKVAVVEHKVAVVGNGQPTLAVEAILAEATEHHRPRFDERVECDPRVTLALGRVKTNLVPVGITDLVLELLGQRPYLLQTQDVGLGRTEPVEKALASGGSQAIDVPREEAPPSFHQLAPPLRMLPAL
jgi:hypothetical protein